MYIAHTVDPDYTDHTGIYLKLSDFTGPFIGCG